MKIFIANESKQSLGGGFSFLSNFRKGMDVTDLQEAKTIEECDIFFIPSSSMVTHDLVEKAQALKKKIVLRVDNVPKNSNNRNTGTSRLKAFAQAADLLVYQSNWAFEYLQPFLGISKLMNIIPNGVDTTIFNKTGAKMATQKDDDIYIYSRFNRDETKGWHVAWYEYQFIQAAEPNAKLWIIGKFSDELVKYNFDFFRGERIEYKGIIEDPVVYAEHLRSAKVLLAPYYNDACSNTIIEALQCGLQINTYGYEKTGGTEQIFSMFFNGYDFSLERMVETYKESFELLI